MTAANRIPMDALFENARAGRGFWAGLFPATFKLDHEAVHAAAPETPAHITLVHLGRDVAADKVERAVTACQAAVSPSWGLVHARSWALARMDQSKGSVVALLMEGKELHALHQRLIGDLAARGIQGDDRYEFHPHMTIGRLGLNEPAALTSMRRLELTFPAISLVCGGARLDFALTEVAAAF